MTGKIGFWDNYRFVLLLKKCNCLIPIQDGFVFLEKEKPHFRLR